MPSAQEWSIAPGSFIIATLSTTNFTATFTFIAMMHFSGVEIKLIFSMHPGKEI